MPDSAWLARLARAREHQERRARLLFPDAKQRLKAIAAAERRALNGAAAPPKPIARAPEITEADIRRACDDLRQNLPDPRLSITGRSERRGPMRRAVRGFDFI